MHWAIDAVVVVEASNGRPEGFKESGPSRYSKSLPGTAGKVFFFPSRNGLLRRAKRRDV